ncbi:hypothetical protein [Clostridium beijerinckii]|uniref:hypothetical protein n=1 Tax=Clostridium beijerinckii TaxID=1520 RepID=UPI00098CB62B|nr:hypothetical protein [Clostridium beijerinckii]MBA8935916.1 uncharacterized protein YlzI (FlbEa/FlbD family) [Clostridium beijerinckii]NRU35988.1 uncharacterized protein YlzI (FlbEa/FlbD family) [Clostridium beijerinckii]NSB00731.1 uncharacterized protein YlzI (FlbEa/FlbD family) [Clostridium beijerinckii]OOM53877.1 hypothetical protein CLOBI_49330 [Clostridium beijerinckii]OOM66970.1 hypothetical protein CLBEIC_45070 [Clostridium beijerinckii]
MVKTVTNKNIDEVLFGQLKAIDFEYLVQLNGLIGDYTDEFGADTLDEEMVTFDITLNSVVKSRIEELLSAEKRVKEIISESRKEDNKVKYVKEAREYLQSLNDMFNGKIVDHECLEVIERLKKNIYTCGSLETQTNVLKTLIESNLEDMDEKQIETTERAKISMYLAMGEVVREVEQEVLDKDREYINAIGIDETKEIEALIDGYELNANWDWFAWYTGSKLGLSHVDEVFLSEYIENNKLCFVFQDGQDFDLCEPYCLK